ncbi:transcriptional regulator [Streptomyces sp. NRRL F-4489]|uniref:ScbA/BarX family gamma-butyrolactone biosynthesis protein n=1 Tax=Streptomyces sp. NRRL F-4489 TaxID=1609095 RepID=UPI0007463784|nr:ScbA/BarX family gamma-butyrolactone biosynthesis protein [Streptomyces sp. NRRL F-4489]KUL47385.1 transcriptional regulator [Streptomyces sp. NRRL F-4489]
MASAILTPHAREPFGGGPGQPAGGNRPPAALPQPGERGPAAAVSGVFLTDWRRGGPGSWLVSARWPAAHGFYGAAHGLPDPLLLIETVRQAGIFLSHVAHGVPLDHPLTWRRVRCDLRPRALPAAGTPADIQLEVTDREVVRRRKRLAGVEQEFRIRYDGEEVAVAALAYSCHSPAGYRRLRGAYGDIALANARRLPPPGPVAPHLVGRERAGDVVLAPADRPDRWQLRVDTAHPVLFDHPVDHVPGMLMVEAVRQAARAAVSGPSLPVALDCAFERYAELDAPCWVRARAGAAAAGDGRREVAVGAEQHGKRVLEARVASVPVGPGG